MRISDLKKLEAGGSVNLPPFDIGNPKSEFRNPQFLWGVRQARFKPLDFQSRDAWVRIPHALPTNRANA